MLTADIPQEDMEADVTWVDWPPAPAASPLAWPATPPIRRTPAQKQAWSKMHDHFPGFYCWRTFSKISNEEIHLNLIIQVKHYIQTLKAHSDRWVCSHLCGPSLSKSINSVDRKGCCASAHHNRTNTSGWAQSGHTTYNTTTQTATESDVLTTAQR